MKRRTVIRLISYGAAVTVAVLAFIITTNNELTHLRRNVTNSYSSSLYELDGSVGNISAALKKAVYSSTPTQFSTIAVELATESNIAVNSLSKLPYSGQTLEKLNKFLSQVGDYSLYLSKKMISGEEISREERDNLNELSDAANSIAHSVEAIRMEYDADGKWTDELADRLHSVAETSLQTNLSNMEELLSDMPTLVYDGPFSDGVLMGEIKMLKGKQMITAEEAKQKAAQILGLDASVFGTVEETGGNMPCYCITSNDITVYITKQGGYLSNMIKHREIGEQTVSYEDAVTIAENYLKNNSGKNFVSTYYFADEGICTVNLAFKEGATLCYPDLIKVGVALDSGEIVTVEAAGYISNHHTRTINTPKYTADEARETISEMLKYESVKRVIVPSDGGKEKHCYEFLCEGVNGEEVLVYLNVSTLEEEHILILLKTDGGTLAK